MRTDRKHFFATKLVPLVLLLLWNLPARVQAQTEPDAWLYTASANNTITITKYELGAFYLTIPSTLGGLPVTTIGPMAFGPSYSLTNITIPASVTNIEDMAFAHCDALQAINVDTNNPAYCSVDGVLFDKSQTTLI